MGVPARRWPSGDGLFRHIISPPVKEHGSAGAQVAKRELALECDYLYEARCQQQFRALVRGDPDLRDVVSVPDVITELSTPHLLTTEWVPGAHIDKVGPAPHSSHYDVQLPPL